MPLNRRLKKLEQANTAETELFLKKLNAYLDQKSVGLAQKYGILSREVTLEMLVQSGDKVALILLKAQERRQKGK